jgi:mono/diheme cytochrome c family protein
MRRLVTLVALTALGCTGPGRSPAPAPAPPAEHMGAHAAAAPMSVSLAAGKRTVETVCATCHRAEPPHRTAPPLRMIAMRYGMATRDSAEAIERIVRWVREPDAEQSLLPAHVIERFGLMPPLPLPEAELRNAAAYVMTLGGHRMGRMP